MSDLDKKLYEILWGDAPDIALSDHALAKRDRIKQAFIDEGWTTPENALKVQQMVDDIANLSNDMARWPRIQYVHANKKTMTAKNLMTGKEWYDLLADELKGVDTDEYRAVLRAAKKASGIND